MWIGYLKDRQDLGFTCNKDIDSLKQLLDCPNTLKNSITYIVQKGHKTFIFIFSKKMLVAIFIVFESRYIQLKLDDRSFCSSQVCKSYGVKLDTSRFFTSSSNIQNYIFASRGGSNDYTFTNDEQKKLIKSLLSKVPNSAYQDISINKLLRKILDVVNPVISNQRIWRILAEFEKPNKFTMIQITNELPSSNRPKNFENVRDDFSSRVEKQKVLNKDEAKVSRVQGQHKRRVNRFNKMLNFLVRNRRPSADVNLVKSNLPAGRTVSGIKQEKMNSNVNSLGRSQGRSPFFGMREKSILSAAPTPDLFSADPFTGKIQNINIAFDQFKQRMSQIANNYIGEKQKFFLEQLNNCQIERFKTLSTELGKGAVSISHVREAETMLQSEFEGIHEPGSITRTTEAEFKQNNPLDGRFRKGLLSGESNTLNEQYTDCDVKVLVSDKTLQYQADQRKNLGHKNPNKMSMYDQGKKMGFSIVAQKHKHCNPTKPELPSSPDNVKHIINTLELLPSETKIAKAGILDGARIAWAEKLNVAESSISDERALQGIMFLNENYTIERVN